jgi:hypothetical protein
VKILLLLRRTDPKSHRFCLILHPNGPQRQVVAKMLGGRAMSILFHHRRRRDQQQRALLLFPHPWRPRCSRLIGARMGSKKGPLLLRRIPPRRPRC